MDALYRDFTDKQITVGEIVELPTRRVFNFADDEANYFAVMEKNNGRSRPEEGAMVTTIALFAKRDISKSSPDSRRNSDV